MSFNLMVSVNAGNSAQVINQVTTGLNTATAAAGNTTAALNTIGQAGAQAGAQVAAGAQRAAAGHQQAAAAAQGHGDALSNLIHLAEAYVGIHVAEGLVDGYVEIRNRTNSVATSAENLNALMGEQFRIAQETRSSWEDLAGTYQRISNAARGLGVSQRQVLDMTEEIAMGMRLSGASSREAAVTMQELTHAFTVGALTGREYKVIAKDAPAFLHEIQVASGRTGAEFAEMGKHGKISAQLLTEWLGKAAPEIRAKFEQMIPTISEGFTLIRNAAQKFFGEAGLGSGVVQKLGEAMKYVADHFEAFGKAALGVGEALVSLYVIEKIVAMVKALTLAIAANPLGALFTAVTVGISLLRQFGDQIDTGMRTVIDDGKRLEMVAVTAVDKLGAIWDALKRAGTAALDFVDTAWHKLTAALGEGIDGSGVELSLRSVLGVIAKFADVTRNVFVLIKDDAVTIFTSVPRIIGEAFVDIGRVIALAFGALINKLVDGINALGRAANAASDAVLGGFKFDSSGKPTATPGPHFGQLAPVDFSFKNPFENASSQYLEDLKDNQRHAMSGSFWKDLAKEFSDDIDAAAKARAVARTLAERSRAQGAVSTAVGDKDPHVASKEEEQAANRAATAYHKLQTELRGILEQSNPVTKAHEELAHAQDVLNKAVAAGTLGQAAAHAAVAKGLMTQEQADRAMKERLITQEAATKALADYRRKNADALDPLGAWVRKQHEENDVLRSTTQETERATDAQKFLNEMKAKGLTPEGTGETRLTPAMISLAADMNAETRHRVQLMKEEQTITSAINDPMKQYLLGLEAAANLLQAGTINSAQYMHAVDGLRGSFLAATPAGKTFAGGMEQAWLKMKQDAENFGVTVANTVVGDLDKLNEAFITAANGGEVAWGKMVDSMIQDLERLIIKQLEVAAINAVINSFAPGLGSVAASTGVTGAVVTGTDWAARSGPSAYPSGPAAYPMPAAPAPSSTTSRQSTTASNGPPVIHVHNHYDESVGIAAIQSPGGTSAVLNILRANGVPIRR